jgi:predicted transcriptional regulator YdeE
MEPTLTTRPAFTVAGIAFDVRLDPALIPTAHTTLLRRLAQLKHTVSPSTVYGVFYWPEAQEPGAPEWYLAGVEVGRTDGLPDGFTAVTVPAREYAVFTCHGSIGRLPGAWRQANQEWLPASGRDHAGLPMFEVYDERHVPTPDCVTECWVPLKPAPVPAG